jgi:NifB/MoaA-like Fe-S oxidoreductase
VAWQIVVPDVNPRQVYHRPITACKPWDRRKKVRLIAVGVTKFETERRQLSLFEEAGEEAREKLERLSEAVDQIREKYGDDAIRRAALTKPPSKR